MCQPGPHLQPTLSTDDGPALGFATGRACEPILDSINVPAATAMGRMYLVIMIISSMVDIPENSVALTRLNAG